MKGRRKRSENKRAERNVGERKCDEVWLEWEKIGDGR
jgi:hypothetical protein